MNIAEKYHKQAKEAKEAKMEKSLRFVFAQIEKESNRGMFDTNYQGTVTDEQLQYLRHNGFVVTTHKNNTVIQW